MPQVMPALFITVIALLVNCTGGPAGTPVTPAGSETQRADRLTETPGQEPPPGSEPETQATTAATPRAPTPTPVQRATRAAATETPRRTESAPTPKDPETAAPFGCGDFRT